MKKTIIHKETYESPLSKEYLLTINRGILDGSQTPGAETPGTIGEDFGRENPE